MLRKLLPAMLLLVSSLFSITADEIDFVHRKELWDIFAYNLSQIRQMQQDSPENTFFYTVLMDYYRAIDDSIQYAQTLFEKARSLHDLESAYSYASLDDHETQGAFLRDIEFTEPHEQAVLQLAIDNVEDDSLRQARIDTLLTRFGEANVILEAFAKQKVDDIAVERDDSLRIEKIDQLFDILPESQWTASLHYLRINAIINRKFYDEAIDVISGIPLKDDATRYAVVLSMLSDDLLDHLQSQNIVDDYLESTKFILNQLIESSSCLDTVRFMYNRFPREEFRKKVKLLQARFIYTDIRYGLVNEDMTLESIERALHLLDSIRYDNNDAGEQAEVEYWKGKILAMSRIEPNRVEAARHLVRCLVLGAPRKRYDEKAFETLSELHVQLEIDVPIMQWSRMLHDYSGIIFEDVTIDAGLGESRESRVAFGDFDNDGDDDLLLSGRKIWRNNGDGTFSDFTEQAAFKPVGASGGLWADINRDGYLDIVVTSHAKGGDAIYIAKGVGYYPVADTTVSDPYPTEGAGLTDLNQDGYPELYMASYEVSGEYIGLQDFFYDNLNGEMIDMSDIIGIRTRYNDSQNAQAGRGVAPADYDNDGVQEILVCNYRLDRNFLFDYNPNTKKVTDIAALEGLAGNNVDGWYGHTIGAAWGDYDNDGDLDLFMCNLAHPRYIEFSDISMLLRNDGRTSRTIDGKTIEYTQFTDVTKDAGITYDELHSDPNWFDADNDGDLDLFMPSIYQNDRSYLYRNNGDGTFTDITWLSGCRTYNGWGNAVADVDLDGRLDLCVGSGSGVRLFRNVTRNNNRSIFIKPFWNEEKPSIVSRDGWRRYMPNTPAWGARIELVYESNDYPVGERLIIREFSSVKGTTSQDSQFIHFGFQQGTLKEIRLLNGDRVINRIKY